MVPGRLVHRAGVAVPGSCNEAVGLGIASRDKLGGATERIFVGAFDAVLDRQVDADQPRDEIVLPVECLTFASVEREQVGAPEASDSRDKRKVGLSTALAE